MRDALSPIEFSWDGWTLDMDRSTSAHVFAVVENHAFIEAVDLGWVPVDIRPTERARVMVLCVEDHRRSL